MTQQGGWGPQGGYPPQQGQGGYPPQQGQGGYPPQQPPPGYPPQQGQGGYPPQQPPPGYPSQPGAYNPQGTYVPQGGYPPQGPGSYGQVPPGGGYPPAGGQPAKKNPGLIIGIVVAALVLLAALGGIIMVLNRDPEGQPGPVSITPTQPVPPSAQPTPSGQPTPGPSATPSEPGGTPEPTPSGPGSEPPSGNAIDLGSGISLTPASGWETTKTGKGVAQLSDGKSVYLGQVIQAEAGTNPGQLCDAWHRKIAEGTSNGKFQDAKSVDLGTKKLSAGSCLAQITVSNGQGSSTVLLFSLVSVRTSDGVTVLGTASFPESADAQQLNKDFGTMTESMLEGQAA